MQTKAHKFIIVDDEQDIRTFLRYSILSCYDGADISEAANGQEALRLFESQGADLMIIDHQIPLLDGLSLVRHLRAQNVTIPLVVISNNPLIEKEAPRAGATAFVYKLQIVESLGNLLPTWLA